MTVFETSRFFPFLPPLVYQAFASPERLAKWWGPDGFTNTIESFDFQEGGDWRFTMHSPDGKHYANVIRFETLVEHQLLVLKHVSEPVFTLTIKLEPKSEGDQTGTLVTWQQAFESDEVAVAMKPIVTQANAQNLSRWLSELQRP